MKPFFCCCLVLSVLSPKDTGVGKETRIAHRELDGRRQTAKRYSFENLPGKGIES